MNIWPCWLVLVHIAFRARPPTVHCNKLTEEKRKKWQIAKTRGQVKLNTIRKRKIMKNSLFTHSYLYPLPNFQYFLSCRPGSRMRLQSVFRQQHRKLWQWVQDHWQKQIITLKWGGGDDSTVLNSGVRDAFNCWNISIHHCVSHNSSHTFAALFSMATSSDTVEICKLFTSHFYIYTRLIPSYIKIQAIELANDYPAG